MKPLLISGIQPTNRLTLGNYLGAIKPIIKLQDEYNCYLFVADWHSSTIPIFFHNFSYQEIETFKFNTVKTYLACGIDPIKTRIFIQSEIKEHLEMFYFLITHSYVGELKRMTQYKHLSKQFLLPNGTEMSLTGLLIYPVLMAADILIYDSDLVSIGEDQTQHLELTKELAERINSKYKAQIFKIPKALKPKANKAGIKVKDLQNPQIKMSKSNKNYEGTIFIDDEITEIEKKIMRCKTDSIGKINFDEKNQPGISNLLEIYANIKDLSMQETLMQFKDKSYLEFKKEVCKVVVEEISEIQKKYKLIKDEDINKMIQVNNDHCREKCKKKLRSIKDNLK